MPRLCREEEGGGRGETHKNAHGIFRESCKNFFLNVYKNIPRIFKEESETQGLGCRGGSAERRKEREREFPSISWGSSGSSGAPKQEPIQNTFFFALLNGRHLYRTSVFLTSSTEKHYKT